MKIKLTDIPLEGRAVAFRMTPETLNNRLRRDSAARAPKGREAGAPNYLFRDGLTVEGMLRPEGTTIIFEGALAGDFVTSCARCTEDTEKHFSVPVKILLKPGSERAQQGEEDDDLWVTYYRGPEIDVAELVEDFFVLALPYVVVCKEDCKGLCTSCGTNLNVGSCNCEVIASKGGPLSKIRDLIH